MRTARIAPGRAGILPRCAAPVISRDVSARATSTVTVRFDISKRVQLGERLALVASTFGWDTAQAVELTWSEGDQWTTTANFDVGAKIEYKYGTGYVIKAPNGTLTWQPGKNRVVDITAASPDPIRVTDEWCSKEHNVVGSEKSEANLAASLSPALPAEDENLAAVAPSARTTDEPAAPASSQASGAPPVAAEDPGASRHLDSANELTSAPKRSRN